MSIASAAMANPTKTMNTFAKPMMAALIKSAPEPVVQQEVAAVESPAAPITALPAVVAASPVQKLGQYAGLPIKDTPIVTEKVEKVQPEIAQPVEAEEVKPEVAKIAQHLESP